MVPDGLVGQVWVLLWLDAVHVPPVVPPVGQLLRVVVTLSRPAPLLLPSQIRDVTTVMLPDGLVGQAWVCVLLVAVHVPPVVPPEMVPHVWFTTCVSICLVHVL